VGNEKSDMKKSVVLRRRSPLSAPLPWLEEVQLLDAMPGCYVLLHDGALSFVIVSDLVRAPSPARWRGVPRLLWGERKKSSY